MESVDVVLQPAPLVDNFCNSGGGVDLEDDIYSEENKLVEIGQKSHEQNQLQFREYKNPMHYIIYEDIAAAAMTLGLALVTCEKTTQLHAYLLVVTITMQSSPVTPLLCAERTVLKDDLSKAINTLKRLPMNKRGFRVYTG